MGGAGLAGAGRGGGAGGRRAAVEAVEARTAGMGGFILWRNQMDLITVVIPSAMEYIQIISQA